MMRILIALVALLLSAPVVAHKPSDSYLRVITDGNQLTVQWDAGLNDLAHELYLDNDANNQLTWRELQSNAERIYAAASRWITLEQSANCRIQAAPIALIRHAGELYAVLEWSGECDRVPQTVGYEFRFDQDPDHRVFVSVTSDDSQHSTLLSPAARILQVSTLSASRSFREFVWQGMTHIWQGYDHLAFLLLLILPVFRTAENNMRHVVIELAKIITAFTIAHSVTLTAAALNLIAINPVLVEALIAVSVIVAALLMWFPNAQKNAAWLAVGFGLLHGFGFANALADLVSGGETPLLVLASFNIGVELGQLAIVILLLPLLWPFRGRRFFRVAIIPSASIAFAITGCYWLFLRLSHTVTVI